MSVSFCRVKFLIRQRIRVLFPTLGGPTTTITIGGGSRGVRSTTGTWCFLVFMSWALFEEQTKINTNTVWRHELDSSYHVMHNTDLWKVLAMRTADWTANALGLRLRSSSSVEPFCFFSFFFSAFGPLCFCWCCFCFLTFPSILSTTHTVHMQFDWNLWTENRFHSIYRYGQASSTWRKKELIWKHFDLIFQLYDMYVQLFCFFMILRRVMTRHNTIQGIYDILVDPLLLFEHSKWSHLRIFPHITKPFSQISWSQKTWYSSPSLCIMY